VSKTEVSDKIVGQESLLVFIQMWAAHIKFKHEKGNCSVHPYKCWSSCRVVQCTV